MITTPGLRARTPCLLFLGAALFPALLAMAAPSGPPAPPSPTGSATWENSLGQRFVPIPGTHVRFSIWDTRVRDFARFVDATGYDATQDVMSMTPDGGKRIGQSWKDPGFPQEPDHPACGLSWYDAQAFCTWLTAQERAAGRITATQHYRLPTDAEWSIAVGLPDEGPGTPEEKSDKLPGVFPWGNQWPPPDNTANYAGDEALAGIWPKDWGVLTGYRDRHPRTSPVGSYPPNRHGLYDMGGNVWQWCEVPGRTPAEQRILRGASFLSHFESELLASHRFRAGSAEGRGIFLGFRCVLDDGAE